MKRYCVEWETDFCEDYPEERGVDVVTAESKSEAIEKVEARHFHSIAYKVAEISAEREKKNV